MRYLGQLVLEDPDILPKRRGFWADTNASIMSFPRGMALLLALIPILDFAADIEEGNPLGPSQTGQAASLFTFYSDDFFWSNAILSAFSHGGTEHFVVNMLFLVAVGFFIEAAFGWRAILALVAMGIAGAIAAKLAYHNFLPVQAMDSRGSSMFIMGMCLFYVLYLREVYFLFGWRNHWLKIRPWRWLAFFLAWSIWTMVNPELLDSTTVDEIAHLGSMLGALLVARWWMGRGTFKELKGAFYPEGGTAERNRITGH
jgi:membrane associated rhomboid family serine protease